MSLYPAEKRRKTESSATFSGSGGSGGGSDSGGSGSSGDGLNRGGSLEEKDAIQMELQGSELWKRFHDIGTEMIITKAGRFGSAQIVQVPHIVGP